VVARTVPAWQLKLLRRFPRIGFVVPVEIFCADQTYQGRSRNLSLGGMLMDADCNLQPRTQIYVSFELPTGWPIKSVARVIHRRPGKQMGIEFTHMGNADWNALGKSIEVKENFQRRSIRIPERLFVNLHWHNKRRPVHEEAQTVLLSRHGCLVLSQAAPPPKSSLVIWCPERRLGAAARVVSCEQDFEGLFMVALEFNRDANFWGIDFEPQDWQRYHPSPN
jgi:hypothetical protein